MSFSEMNRRTLAFRGGGLVTASAGGSTNNNAGGEALAWPFQPPPRQPLLPAPQQLNGRGADEEVELEGLEPQDLEAAVGVAAEEAKELLLPQDGGGPTSLGAGGAGGPLLAERNRRSLAFRGGGGGLGNNGRSRGRPGTSAWPLRHFNGRGPAAGELELDALEGKELMPDGASLSDSTEDEEGASLGDGSGAEGGSCGSSRRSGGDGGDEAEGSGVGAGEGETVQHLPLARPKSLMQKLHCSFQSSWLKDFPWLRYSKDTGLMSCGWCQKTPEDGGSGDLPLGGHDELSRGTRNYKKTLLLRHHVSTEHKANAQESETPSEEGYCDLNNRPNENSYCYQLLRQLNEQRKKGILCDVSIVVSGQIFKAHKNILVAGSRFFKTLYCFSNKESPNQNNTTHLDIAAVQGFSVILDFLYSGNLVLTSHNAIEVMTVASYLQMSEVVQTCRNFIKDALNISIKSEAPESVVVDYNNRKPINRDGQSSSRDQKIASFWATRNLTNLASNVKIENDGCNVDEGQIENYQMNDSSWVQDGSPELTESESQGQTKVFIWNDMGSQGIQETSKTRRKNQTAKRFIYNVPPNNESNLDDCSMMQPPVAYPEEDLPFIKEEPDLDGTLLSGPDCERNVNASLLVEAAPSQEGNDAGTSNDFKYGLMPGASNDFKYGLLPESWPKQETWENGESTAVNKLKCTHCNYVAKYRRTLKRHLLIHTGVRSFSCEICGKLFTRREHVKRHSLVHKKDKKYKCMMCKKIFMLAASVGIRHGSRRYGVCVDCADKTQPGGQEGIVDQGQDTDFPRDEEFEENEVGEADEELVDDGEDQNDPSRWDESGDVSMSLDD
ncbi:PREDICTED: zinc finger and BTB domain-containing protein 10-like isoform X2 [Elephantulus edwardii]|uniref:zinc finger and BTB domain-containing protein 10-like isoform X2 n=1 Tax=Elephantulus edwardii TaxID=28737 RepID=UPI0003F0B691|nr:PREDICTED: zinc finger and BTB domain-containing protein 10-like isoform X2 [Elephantulus edwardii]